MHAGIGGHGGADIDADGRRVDELHVRDALGADIPDVRRQRTAADACLQRGDQALEHHGRLAGAGHAGHDRQPPLWDVDLQRLDRVDLRCGQMNGSLRKHVGLFSARAQHRLRPAGQERSDLRGGIRRDRGHRPLRDDAAALRACLRPHLDDPVGLLQDLRIMIDQNDGIAVRHKVVHHPGEAHDVGRVQADARFIEHIEYAGRAVAHGAGQLHSLPLAGGERRRGAVKRQVAESQIEQPPRRARKGLADALGHGTHLLRQTVRRPLHPVIQLRERHRAGLVERNAAQLRRAGSGGQACAMAVRAHILFQKLLDALHALLILDLGKGVFHGIDGVKVGKVQLPRLIGVFGVIKNVLFLRRSVVDDVLLPRRQVAKRHVRAHAHLPADVRHQRPHEAVPRRHRALVNGERIIRHQRRHVHRADAARAAASGARPLRVEGQLLGARCVKVRAARRTGQLLSRGHQQ